MLEQKSTYIYSIEGKDLYNNILEIKKNKKFKASLDFSLESIQIETVAQSVYKGKKERENIFYQEEQKQYTNKVINLTFKYNVKEYNLITVKDNIYYVLLNSGLDNKTIKDVIFENGVYIEKEETKLQNGKIEEKDVIKAIEINAETTLKSKDLPQGFSVNKENKIYLNSTGIKTIANTDEVRNELYKHGFKIKINGKEIEYVRFKRSSGSSRVGKCLFIDKRLYKDMLEWSMMGLIFNPKEEIDLAAIEAYISLTTSSIIDTIKINSENILLIDDYESIFEDAVMVTEIKKETYINEKQETKVRDRLYTSPQKTKITNSIWDGQSLLDSSLFEEKYKDKGFLLLRNRFVKSACFNTNIQQFFNNNDINDVSQLNGKTLAKNIEDIKLITTPSSIKYLKFGSWKDFIDNCSETWGVVKYDKPTHYFKGKMVQTHYQLLNTLQLNEDETKEFLKNSLDYVKLLKTDIRVFREHLHIKIKDNIEYGDMNSTDEFIMTMLQLNNKFENTDLFNTFRQDSIKSYIRNMKKGHILINGNYSVLCGNGLEMLKSTIKDKSHKMAFNGQSLLNVDEVYTKNFRYDKELIGSRSPHVTMGNVWLCKNTDKEKADKINKYFNSSKQIIHINSINNNILERLSGADFDSDQLLISDNELLISKAKQNYDKFLVPTSLIHAKKVPRLNTPEQKCDLDIKTSKNLIGEIINCSQILNSMLWDIVNSNKNYDKNKVDELYADISQLDVMSCIEIDKAKKEFSIDNQLELDTIREKHIQGNKKPYFFKFLAKEKGNKIKASNYRKYKTTMDYLISIIDKGTKDIKQKYRKGENKVITFGELLSKDSSIKVSNAKINTAKEIIEKSEQVRLSTILIWNDNKLNSEEKYNQVKEIKNNLINFVSKKQVSSSTIKKIIYDLNQESIKIKKGQLIKSELNKNARNLLRLLYHSHKEEFIKIFEDTKEKIEVLEIIYNHKTNDKDIKIYDFYYKICEK